jgi:OmpA-OmpF porin, OOP family
MDRFMPRAVLAFIVVALAACAGPSAPPSKSFFVFFAVDGAELRPEAIEVIDRVAAEARNSAATGVRILGHASPAGAPAHNLRLAEERAAAVEAALVARGVPRELLVRTSQGATPVIGPEIEGQRVEVVVVRETR